MIVVKHKAPLSCRIAVKLFGKSPSAMLAKCTLGRQGVGKCMGCECHVPEIIGENFQKGLQDGLKTTFHTVDENPFNELPEVEKVEKIKLTREDAIREFRKMWNWIADMTLQRKHKVYKFEYFEENNLPEIDSWCYLCEYAGPGCGRCPIEFPTTLGICSEPNSPYQKWFALSAFDWLEAARLAREIAELPERKRRMR